jgi:hypothetical protein
VSCASATICAAAGYYTDSSGNQQGLLLTWSGTSWTATKAPLPAGASTMAIESLSCDSALPCVVTGHYTDSSGNQQGLLLTWSGTSWTATTAPLPAGAATPNPGVDIGSVSCTSATTCIASGYYIDSSGTPQGLLLTGSG